MSDYKIKYTQTNSKSVPKLVFQFEFSQEKMPTDITTLKYDLQKKLSVPQTIILYKNWVLGGHQTYPVSQKN